LPCSTLRDALYVAPQGPKVSLPPDEVAEYVPSLPAKAALSITDLPWVWTVSDVFFFPVFPKAYFGFPVLGKILFADRLFTLRPPARLDFSPLSGRAL